MGNEARLGDVPGQGLGHGGQGVLGVGALGAAQVGEEDQRGPPLQEVAQGGKAFQDPGLILDHAALDGDVVIHPHQDPLPPGVQVLQGAHLDPLPEDQLHQVRHPVEYPHSLSYQAKTLTMLPKALVSLASTMEECGSMTMSCRTISSSV
jgi:hypothetical protein